MTNTIKIDLETEMAEQIALLREDRFQTEHGIARLKGAIARGEVGRHEGAVLLQGPESRLRAVNASLKAAALVQVGAPEDQVREALREMEQAEGERLALLDAWAWGPAVGGVH